jgi:hypothetical protein
MKKSTLYLIALTCILATPLASATAQTRHTGDVADAYRVANFVVAYSTPQERDVLSHYAESVMLPASYQTARLVRVHDCMQVLASGNTPVTVIRNTSEAVLAVPIPELTAIETIGEDSNGVGVHLTVHSLDVRTNLRMIASFEASLADGKDVFEANGWRNSVDGNPWRREMHRWRKEEGAWRIVDDRVAMLKAR